MKKTLRIGTTKEDGTPEYSTFIRIEFANGKLSITGVEGPRAGGNAYGGAGQILTGYKEYDKRGYKSLHEIKPAPGWTHAKIKKLFDTWNRWHMNDMRPNCEHQTGPDWEYREITFKKHHLSYRAQSQLKTAANKEMDEKLGYCISLEKINSMLAAAEHSESAAVLVGAHDMGLLEYGGSYVKDWEVVKNYPALAKYLKENPAMLEETEETKGNGWMYEKDHPAGILCKPCPVCGYKYGSAWKHEDVPTDVLEFLQSLPDTDITPAWV